MSSVYRKFTKEEIKILESNECYAESWDNVEVSLNFDVRNLRGAVFGGKVRIGDNNGCLTNRDGIVRKAGIYNAELINCTIGDNVFISNIGAYIANYDIGNNVYIENVGKIVCRGENCFGNGIEAVTVNENGGREVPIHNTLSAQVAYIMAMYRHRPKMVERMRAMIEDYCKTICSDRGTIAEGARIVSSNTLRDVNVGPYAAVNCATMLTNGTINSSKESPTYLGAGVKAHDFICSHGALIDNGATLNRCYIGEACRIDYGYTVADSLFFSNCHCANGEACSIFAGPYTVSHHKSSLLIAGYFLFFNAGSGANQSNHLFKTGAVHQGVHERGCKFASDAYVMLPAREGPFTVIIGRHKCHHNTAVFPYSFLMEEEGKSYLVPGINLRSYGTLRDLKKWARRDKRGPLRRDRINFEEHNPYMGVKLLEAIKESKKMLARNNVETHNYNMVRIKSSMLRRGMDLYQLALDALIGYILAKGFATRVEADSHWVDAAGMFAPKSMVDGLIAKIENGSVTTLEEVNDIICDIDSSYGDYAYAWAVDALGTLLERQPTEKDITDAIMKGAEANAALKKMREDDSVKDANDLMATGYGIDSVNKEEIYMDFNAVRKLQQA